MIRPDATKPALAVTSSGLRVFESFGGLLENSNSVNHPALQVFCIAFVARWGR
jgi:hypothetical protein